MRRISFGPYRLARSPDNSSDDLQRRFLRLACCFGLYDVELEAWVIAGRLNVSVYMAVKAFDQNFIVGANGIDASRHNGLPLSVYQDPVAVRQGSMQSPETSMAIRCGATARISVGSRKRDRARNDGRILTV